MFSLSADAVLSFANQTTLVSMVMTHLTEFLVLWTQTPSDYERLISRTFPSDWAASRLPVLSRKGTHVLYTGYQVTQPNGGTLVCPGCEGVWENRGWKVHDKRVRVFCRLCDSTCDIDKVVSDTKDMLEQQGLVKVEFPPERINANWAFPGLRPQPQVPATFGGVKYKKQAPSASCTDIPPSTSPSVLPPAPSMESLL